MLWVKSLHVISVIAWMAALLYLPRLLVYHAESTLGSEKSETFKVMERRLLKGIINPAMGATWLLGIFLTWAQSWYLSGWLWAKVAAVIALSALHGQFTRWVREFAEDRNARPARFYRIMNEVPTLLMVVIVILVIVKPF